MRYDWHRQNRQKGLLSVLSVPQRVCIVEIKLGIFPRITSSSTTVSNSGRHMRTEKILPDLLTYTEAAEELTVSVSTVRRLCKQGLLTLYQIAPRCHRIKAASLQTYLQETSVTPQPLGSTSRIRAVPSKRVGAETQITAKEALERVKAFLKEKRAEERARQR